MKLTAAARQNPAGWADTKTGTSDSLLYGTKMTDLGQLGAYGINDSGQIAGTLRQQPRPARLPGCQRHHHPAARPHRFHPHQRQRQRDQQQHPDRGRLR
jgi:hypothetical protein